VMNLKRTILALAFTFAVGWSADLTVQRAQMYGPNGPISGKLVMTGDRMIFVDDARPEMSFQIPRSDVRNARLEGGRLTIDLQNPYASSLGPNQSSLVLVMPDQNNAGTIVSWMGVPVTGFNGEASRVNTGVGTTEVTNVKFDVKNGDQRGQLIMAPDMLIFESLTDARHSRRWAYSTIRELTHNDHEIKIEPYHGDKYEFQFSSRSMLDTAYQLLSDRVVAARVSH